MWMNNTLQRSLIKKWEYGTWATKHTSAARKSFTEWKKPRKSSISSEQKEWNLLLQFYRARNEHLISELKQSRAAINQKWRGSYALLRAIVDLSVQFEALQEAFRICG